VGEDDACGHGTHAREVSEAGGHRRERLDDGAFRRLEQPVETADIALMSDQLAKVPWLIGHARRTLRIVKCNVAFALGLKIAFLLLSCLGLASLWAAIAADTGASLLVIANGLRLLKADKW